MADKIRWGILSTARIGKTKVVPAMINSVNGEVVAVASRDAERARAYADELGIPKSYGSYEDLLADPDIDAIYNPLPNDQHAEWSNRAAEAGKHVLCEKPLASNAAEARMMAQTFERADRLLAEAFMYRYHPQTLRVKEMIQNGAVGTVQLIDAGFTFPIHDENNIRLFGSMAGGALMDVGCYCVGVMRFMTGEEPVAVNAFSQFNDRDADEKTAGILAFPSGVFGHFDCGLRTYRLNTYEIRGSQGRIVVETGFTPAKTATTVIRYWYGDAVEEIRIDPVDQYQLMAEDFADAILNQRPPRYPVEDAVHEMEMLDALHAAAESNRAYTSAK